MRVKVLLIIATIIVAGILALAVTANAAFATSIELQQTISNGASSVTQSSTQTSSGLPGTQTSSSHNQLVVGPNQGNTVSAASGSDLAAGLLGLSNIANIANGASSVTQSSTQTSSGLPGTQTSSSHNQLVVGPNQGNTVSAASGSDPKGGGYGASSGISQSNTQSTFCLAITSNSDSCNQIAANFNFGNAISTAIAQFGAR
jgi:hypothetical protein